MKTKKIWFTVVGLLEHSTEGGRSFESPVDWVLAEDAQEAESRAEGDRKCDCHDYTVLAVFRGKLKALDTDPALDDAEVRRGK